jgi:hypothetical protein
MKREGDARFRGKRSRIVGKEMKAASDCAANDASRDFAGRGADFYDAGW